MTKHKHWILGFMAGALMVIPMAVLSAPSLSAQLKGKILLAVEDKGKTYYVSQDGHRYRVTKETAQKIFEKLALGISNSDLAKIPENTVSVDPEQFQVAPVNQYQEIAPKTITVDNPQLQQQINMLTLENNTLKQQLNSESTILSQTADQYNDVLAKYNSIISALPKFEAAIEDLITPIFDKYNTCRAALGLASVQQSPIPSFTYYPPINQSIHCTSSIYGNTVFTNCY